MSAICAQELRPTPPSPCSSSPSRASATAWSWNLDAGNYAKLQFHQMSFDLDPGRQTRIPAGSVPGGRFCKQGLAQFVGKEVVGQVMRSEESRVGEEGRSRSV